MKPYTRSGMLLIDYDKKMQVQKVIIRYLYTIWH
jgi:hypothetical protein